MTASYKFDLEAYFHRINFSGDTEPSEDTLERLHHAHFHRICFENFDILLGRGINLAPQALFNKLVLEKRGGYCFELNGLFLGALKALGFKARALLGRVHLTGTPSGRGHQLALVSIRGRDWVADVGFGGDSPSRPMPLELGRPVTNGAQTLRLTEAGDWGIMLQTYGTQGWKDLYSFDLGHVCPADIAYGNHYTSTHPNSFFTFSRVAALPIPDGEITLLDQVLSITKNKREEKKSLPDSPAYLKALSRYFSIDLDADYKDLKPLS